MSVMQLVKKHASLKSNESVWESKVLEKVASKQDKKKIGTGARYEIKRSNA